MTQDVTEFVEELRRAQASFVQGDPRPLMAMWSHADDVTIMGGFGAFERGWAAVGPRLEWACSQFRDGVQERENVTTFFGDDVGYLVSIDRNEACVGSSGKRTVQVLRVTQVFRREDGEWRIVHRHADELRPKQAPTGP